CAQRPHARLRDRSRRPRRHLPPPERAALPAGRGRMGGRQPLLAPDQHLPLQPARLLVRRMELPVTSTELSATGTPSGSARFIPTPVTPYQGDIARYWDREARPVNLRLGDVDGLYHHHYGIGEVDHAALGDTGDDGYEQRLIAELHRLESAQAEFL